MSDSRQYVHELIDRLPAPQLTAVAKLLETIISPDEDRDTLSKAERRAVA
jgi:hypothetical protein